LKPCQCPKCNGKKWNTLAFDRNPSGSLKSRTRKCINRIRKGKYPRTAEQKRKASELASKGTHEKWLCKCPRCGLDHQRLIYWTGRQVDCKGRKYKPHIYCDICTKSHLGEDEEMRILL